MSTNTTETGSSSPESVSTPSDTPPANTPTSTPADTPTPPPPDTSSTTTESTPPPPPPPPTTTTTSTSETPTSTSTQETTSTSNPPPTTTSTTVSPTSETSSTSETPPPTSVITTTQATTGPNGSTQFITVTSTQAPTRNPQSSSSSSSTGPSDAIISPGSSSSGSITEPAKIAVAVVVPIAAVALLVLAGIFFWRRRKQRKDAAEERRKEVEDYSYNPNNDPTLPDVGAATGAYEMKEDGSSGYRGWGSTTLAGSTGRKASTTMSGGVAGAAYSDATSPTRGNFSDTRSGDGLVNEGSNSPPEGEILGAMGPTADNRGNGDVRRGPSNASSSYSATGRSDGSGENGGSYGGPAYLDQYGGNNPYADGAYGQQPPGEFGAQPIIRDNPARRNTRIENPSHYPQQSAGISQNF